MWLLWFTLLWWTVAGTFTKGTNLTNTFRVEWKVEGTDIHLKLMTTTASGWLGFGFAEQTAGSMPGSDIAVVAEVGGSPMVTDMYAMGKERPLTDATNDWSVVESGNTAGWRWYHIKRALDTKQAQDRAVIQGRQRVVYAWGSTPQMSYHSTNRGATSIDFHGTAGTPDPDPSWESVDMVFSNYSVPTAETTYACQSFTMPKADQYIVRIDPIVQLHKVAVHHFLLHICKPTSTQWAQFTSPGKCPSPLGNFQSGCTSTIYGWAVGMGAFVLPNDVGFYVGDTDHGFMHAILEIHYDNPGNVAGEHDSSGVRIYYDSAARSKASVIIACDGTVSHPDLPPQVPEIRVESNCPSECTTKFTHPITIIGEFLHMHEIGTQMISTVTPKGGQIEELNRIDFWDVGFQQMNPVANKVVNPGDNLGCHCVFSTENRNQPTEFSVGSRDEMCMNFITYYPLLPFDNKDTETFNFCGSRQDGRPGQSGNVTLCGSLSGVSSFIPLSNPTTRDPISCYDKTFGKTGDLPSETACRAGSGTAAPTAGPTDTPTPASPTSAPVDGGAVNVALTLLTFICVAAALAQQL